MQNKAASLLKSIPYPITGKTHLAASNAWYMLLLNFVICIYLANILGINYSPINDAWPAYVATDQGRHTLDAYLYRIKTFGIQSRFFRYIPMLISSYVTYEGFLATKAFFFTLNLLTGLGVYLLASVFFPSKRLFAAICALFYYYHSFDGTLFWLGAPGANISLFAAVYSLYFFQRSLNELSYRRLIYACGFIFLGCLSYEGPIIIWSAFIGLLGILWIYNWKTRGLFFLIYIVCFILAIIPVVADTLNGTGRAVKVVDFQFETITSNFATMFGYLFVKTPISLATLNIKYLLGSTIIAALSFLTLRLLPRNKSNELPNSETKISLSELMFLSAIGLGLIIAGFLAYSVTNLPISGNRVLLFSRAGFVLMLISLAAFILGKLFKSQKSYKAALSTFGALIVFLTIQDKAFVAQKYHDESFKVRKFLAELVETVPAYKKGSVFLFHLPPNYFSGKASMIHVRPKSAVQYVYKDYKTNAISVSDYALSRFGMEEEDGELNIRGRYLPTDKVIALKYDPETGFSPLKELTWSQKINGEKIKKSITLSNTQNTVERELTARQKWFVEHQN